MDPEMDRKFVHLVVDGGDGRRKDRVQTGNHTPEAYGTDGDGTVAASGLHNQQSDKRNLCHNCQIRTSKNILVNLGCACKHPLGRPHDEWRISWFQYNSRDTWVGVIHDKRTDIATSNIGSKKERKARTKKAASSQGRPQNLVGKFLGYLTKVLGR